MVRPDYRDFQNRSLLTHFGVGAQDNPPGRGSGRYPYGSGARPFQDLEGVFNGPSKLMGVNRKERMKETTKKFLTTALKIVISSVAGNLAYQAGVSFFEGVSEYNFLKEEFAKTNVNKAIEEYKSGINNPSSAQWLPPKFGNHDLKLPKS